MHEQINERSVAISVKATKMTGNLLARAMRAYLRSRQTPGVKHGKQSLKSLSKQGAGLANIPLSDDNIATFNRTARKYNVDYSLKKDASGTPPRWVVFFKARDADALTAAFGEYSRAVLKQKERKPSLLAALRKAVEQARAATPPAKNRKKGEHEL